MIEIKFKRINISLHFSFFAAVSLMLLFNAKGYAVWGLYACLIHELGHIIVMLITNQSISRIVFYGAGIKIIQSRHDIFTPFYIQTIILLAGSFMNFFVFTITKSVQINSFEFSLFGTINCMIGIFNLLPLNCLDGGKLIVLVFYKLCDYENAVKLEKHLRSVNAALVICVICFLALCGFKNMTLYLTLLYILFSALLV